jgi:hypothetical protein
MLRCRAVRITRATYAFTSRLISRAAINNIAPTSPQSSASVHRTSVHAIQLAAARLQKRWIACNIGCSRALGSKDRCHRFAAPPRPFGIAAGGGGRGPVGRMQPAGARDGSANRSNDSGQRARSAERALSLSAEQNHSNSSSWRPWAACGRRKASRQMRPCRNTASVGFWRRGECAFGAGLL